MSSFWRVVMGTVVPAMVYRLIDTLPVLVKEFASVDRNSDYYSSRLSISTPFAVIEPEAFDFIIVGAGSSGSLLAHRLSKDFKVLVLEAGGTPNPLMIIPGMGPMLVRNPDVDWMYQTVPQKKSCFSLNNQQSNWPRGKMEGGTSNLNALVYLRGHPSDYNNWADITGDSIWNYQNVSKFFKKFEKFENSNDPKKGLNGELVIEDISSTSGALTDYFVYAGLEAGYPKADLNGIYTEGFDNPKFTKKRGSRWEGYSAFLQPAKDSPDHDLTVYKYATVTQILLDERNRAYGVEYERHGFNKTVYATKEVIVSAGTVNSPKLLMLSGIGPKEHLESKGVKVRVDLPGVGKNLQDHVGTYVGMFTINETLTFRLDRDISPSTLLEYMTDGTGPLSSAGIHSVGVVSTEYEIQQAKEQNRTLWPDIQLSLIGLSIPSKLKIIGTLPNIKMEVFEGFYRPHEGTDSFLIFVFPTRPQGRGEILLADDKPNSAPLIDPKYLENDNDVKVVVEGMKMAVKLIENSKEFKAVGGKLSKIPLPPCKTKEFASDEYWECYLRHMTLTLFHPAGTCAMGKTSDPMSVLDSEMKVKGVKNLRVIDASVFPVIVSTNINAACNVVAEIGADFIKKTWISPYEVEA